MLGSETAGMAMATVGAADFMRTLDWYGEQGSLAGGFQSRKWLATDAKRVESDHLVRWP